MLARRETTPLQYWLVTGRDWSELQNIALRIFNVAPSSTSAEHNFSAFGFLHSKARNKLGPERVEKLVFIKFNHSVMFKKGDDDNDEF